MVDRKRIIFSGLFLSVLLIILPGYCQDNQPPASNELTLPNAISIAFQNNKDIQIQEQEITVASANILGSKSAFLSQVNLQGSYTYNDKV